MQLHNCLLILSSTLLFTEALSAPALDMEQGVDLQLPITVNVDASEPSSDSG